jgi:hypothetical protein
MLHDVEPGLMPVWQTQGVTADGKGAARINDFFFKEFKGHAGSPK